ncbi:hypothetical protein BOTBODRAFT_122711, partial [Botryobasidium botryosum FD-172 SS1]
TRGKDGNFPCPICLVPKDCQHDLSEEWPERSAAQSQQAYEDATYLYSQPRKKGQADQRLKDLGLRHVKNAFWLLGPRSCPHRALSFDVLHVIDSGMWGKHVWVDLKAIIEEAGNINLLNERQLHNFPKVSGVDFADGSKGHAFDFPKAHAYHHLFDHIERKGSTKNYNTKLGEAMHTGFKSTFEQTRRSDDFEEEVLFFIILHSESTDRLNIAFL